MPTTALSQIKELELGGMMMLTAVEKKPDLLNDAMLPWRPFYLQRKILASFAVVFVGLALIFEALYYHSNRGAGLAGVSDRSANYLWRLGPVVILLVITALWNRGDYQAKISAPWIRLAKGPVEAERTLLLDYLGTYLPCSIVQAVRNRDLMVACTAAIALLLRIVVVISTGFVATALVSLPGQTAPGTATTGFSEETIAKATAIRMGLTNAGALALYTTVGVLQDNGSYPDGVSARYAYQQFSVDAPAGSTITATVDGLSAGLNCEPAQLSLMGVQSSRGIQQFNTSFVANGCNITMPIISNQFANQTNLESSKPSYFARFGRGGCGGSTREEDQRIVIVVGTQTIDSRSLSTDEPSGTLRLNGSITQSTQLICRTSYDMIQVEVTTMDGSLMDIQAASNSRNVALSAQATWNLTNTFFESHENALGSTFNDTTPRFYQEHIINVDAIMHLALETLLVMTGRPPSPHSLMNATRLERLASNYFQQYMAVLASSALTQSFQSSSPITVTVEVTEERLMVSFLVTQALVGLLGLCALMAVAVTFLVPKKGILPRNPGTIMDMAALISNSRGLLQVLRGAGGGDMKTIRERLTGHGFYTGVEAYERSATQGYGYFKIFGGGIDGGSSRWDAKGNNTPMYVERREFSAYPKLLHPAQRLTVFVAMIGLIIGLDIALQASERDGGLGDVPTTTDGAPYIHLLWTVLPALVFGLFTAFFVSNGFTIRSLAPYAALRRGDASFEQSMSLNLADKASPVALYQAIRLKNIAVGGASAAALLSGLFVVFASTLFAVDTVPVTASCQLLVQDFFVRDEPSVQGSDFCGSCQNGTVMSSLVLDGNASYPAFTYEDLAFPALALAGVPSGVVVPDELVVSAPVFAVRPLLECRTYVRSEIHVELETSGNSSPALSSLRVSLPGEFNEGNDVILISTSTSEEKDGTRLNRDAFFGAGAYRPIAATADNNGNQTPHWIWVWGQLTEATADRPAIRHIAALSCNETIQEVNVFTTFVGPALDIDLRNPPTPDESSTSPFSVTIVEGDLDYHKLIPIATTPDKLLDPFFASLVASRYAIPVSQLGDPSPEAIESVSSAIQRQHRIIRTQVISTQDRRALADPVASNHTYPATLAVSTPLTPRDTENPDPARDDLGDRAHRRVLQDPATTRTLQGLIAAVLLLSITSWLALPRPNAILPRAPYSIASVAALLADGNIFGLLGRGAEWTANTEELHAYFRDGLHVTMGFQMGWERARTRSQRRRGRGRERGIRQGGEEGTGEGGRGTSAATWGHYARVHGEQDEKQVFGVSAVRTGGWGGGENVGLGMQARVGLGHRGHVRDWGWRT